MPPLPFMPADEDAGETDESGRTRMGSRAYTGLGIVSGAIAWLLIPIVFGAVSIFCGVQLFRRHSEFRGLVIIAWGGVSLVAGVLLGLAAA